MTTWQAGDIGAEHGTAFVDRLIQFGQRVHGTAGWRWNHVFVVTDDQGNTVEAQGRGVVRSNISAHKTTLNLGCPPAVDRSKVVSYAESKLGVEYGYFNDFLLGIDCLLDTRLHWTGDQVICSELAALALHAGGWRLEMPPALYMPADIVDALTKVAV